MDIYCSDFSDDKEKEHLNASKTADGENGHQGSAEEIDDDGTCYSLSNYCVC